MPILFACPNCRSPLKVADEHAGKKVRCGKCKEVVEAPVLAIPLAAPVEAPIIIIPLDHEPTAVTASAPAPLLLPSEADEVILTPKLLKPGDAEILTPKLLEPGRPEKRGRRRAESGPRGGRDRSPKPPKRGQGLWILLGIAGFVLLVGGAATYLLVNLSPRRGGGFGNNIVVKKEERKDGWEEKRDDFRKDEKKDDFPFPKEEKKVEEKEVEEKKIGVEINDLVVGTGREAVVGDALKVTYVCKLLDGTEVERTQNPQQGYSFTLGTGSVIKGWDIGLVGMRAGGVRILTIAPELAYGDLARQRIPANSVLVFEIELVSFR